MKGKEDINQFKIGDVVKIEEAIYPKEYMRISDYNIFMVVAKREGCFLLSQRRMAVWVPTYVVEPVRFGDPNWGNILYCPKFIADIYYGYPSTVLLAALEPKPLSDMMDCNVSTDKGTKTIQEIIDDNKFEHVHQLLRHLYEFASKDFFIISCEIPGLESGSKFTCSCFRPRPIKNVKGWGRRCASDFVLQAKERSELRD